MLRKICLWSLKRKTVTWPSQLLYNFISGISSINFNLKLCLKRNFRGSVCERPLHAYCINKMYTQSLNLFYFNVWLLFPNFNLNKLGYKIVLKCICYPPTIPGNRLSCLNIIRIILSSFPLHYYLIRSFSYSNSV